MAEARKGINLENFPKLKFDDACSALVWEEWLSEFTMLVEVRTVSLGTVKVDEADVPVFNAKHKFLAFMVAIGNTGRKYLTSMGLDKDKETAYEDGIRMLATKFGSKPSKIRGVARQVSIVNINLSRIPLQTQFCILIYISKTSLFGCIYSFSRLSQHSTCMYM